MTFTCQPIPSQCRQLEASAAWWRVIDALGISPEQLNGPHGDLRPKTFVAPGFRATREEDAAYIAWTSKTLPDDDSKPSFGFGTSVPIVRDKLTDEPDEQRAGALLLEFARLGTGPDGQALSRWLQLWGWEPPPAMKKEPPPPKMVI